MSDDLKEIVERVTEFVRVVRLRPNALIRQEGRTIEVDDLDALLRLPAELAGLREAAQRQEGFWCEENRLVEVRAEAAEAQGEALRKLLGRLHSWFLQAAPEHYRGCGLHIDVAHALNAPAEESGRQPATVGDAIDQMDAAWDRVTIGMSRRDAFDAGWAAGFDFAESSEQRDLKRDAERFRALMRCGRIKMQGSAGVNPNTGERNGNNVHFGAEFWPEHLPDDYRAKHPEETANYDRNTRWGVACIAALADAIIERDAKPPAEARGDQAEGEA